MADVTYTRDELDWGYWGDGNDENDEDEEVI